MKKAIGDLRDHWHMPSKDLPKYFEFTPVPRYEFKLLELALADTIRSVGNLIIEKLY